MAGTLLWVRRFILAALGIVCLIGLGGAVVAGHAVGATLWVLALLATLALCAVLFGERFLSNPAAVVAEVSGLPANLPNSLLWLKDLIQDLRGGKVPVAQAVELGKQIVADELAKAANATPVQVSSTGGPVA